MRKIAIFFLLIVLIAVWGCEKVSNPQYHVDKESCNACGECLVVCPVDAIEFDADGKAVIDQTKCNQCGKCINVCPQDAIY